jgi:hypothetical protein
LVDNLSSTKWYSENGTTNDWVNLQFNGDQTFSRISFTSANDQPERDPLSAVMSVWSEAGEWTPIGTYSPVFTARYQEFNIDL